MGTEEAKPSSAGWTETAREQSQPRWYRRSSVRRWECIWNLIWNLFFLYIVNKVPHWHLEFINERYMVVLWILNANILVHIASSILMLLADFRAIYCIGKILMGASSFVTLLVLYFLNPFDFSQVQGLFWLDRFLPILFIIGMVGSAISVIIYLWRLIFR